MGGGSVCVSGSAMQGLWENYELSSYVMHTHRVRARVIDNQKHRGVCWGDRVIISVKNMSGHNQPFCNTSSSYFVLFFLFMPFF